MKKIIALGASNSKNSINKQFAFWVSSQIENVDVDLLDLNEYPLPIYGIDLEKESGIPRIVEDLKLRIESADAFVISLAEHNGNYSAVFKNTQDWLSRIDKNIWNNKPTLLLATSPGKRGGKSVLEIAEVSFPRMGSQVVGSFSLPSFHNNFNEKEGLHSVDLMESFETELNKFKNVLF